MENTHESHDAVGVHHKPWEHTALKVLSWGGLATAALALAPVVLPLVNKDLFSYGENAVNACISGAPRGLSGSIYNMFQSVPGIGVSLATGGLATALLSGGIAIGGLWLANHIDQRTKQGEFRWGSVVRWAALATSMLIALPAIVPAISMGVNFFAQWSGSAMLSGLATDLGALGAVGGSAGGMSTALGAAGLAAVHMVTCALPLGVAGLFLGQREETTIPVPQLKLPALNDGRLMPIQRAVA